MNEDDIQEAEVVHSKEVEVHETELEKALAKYSSPVSVREKPPHLKSLFYGFRKSGKTVMAAKVTERPLLLACDAGWVSLRDWPELQHVEVIEYQGLRHFDLLTKALKDDVKLYREFDHVIVDPISTAAYDYIAFLQENYSPSGPDTRITWVPKRESKERPFTTSGITDYNALLQQFRPSVYRLGLIHKDVTYIAHVKDPSFMNPKDKSLKPNLPGSLASLLQKEVGVIGYVEADGDKRTVSMRATVDEDSGSWLRKLHGKRVPVEQYPEIIRKWKTGEL